MLPRKLRCEALEPRLMLAKDLQIVSVQLTNAVGEITGATPVVGEKVYAVVHYQSTDLAPGDQYNIRWEMDGVATQQFNFVGFSGTNVDLFWYHGGWIAPAGGTHSVTVTVDSGNSVAESDEGNNSLSTPAFTAEAPTSLPQKFALPLAGVQNVDWVIGGYVDVNPKSFADDPNDFFEDFQGNKSTTRDFHNGIDVGLVNFRAQDQGVTVRAAAAGTVVEVRDGTFDRETFLQFADAGNYVFIDHGNGWVSQYYHLRRDSIAVGVGAQVAAGQALGLVGSSGNSAGPHLHFEVQHNKSPVDLYADPASYWITPPPYVYDAALPHTVLDSGVTNDIYDGVHTFVGPPLEHFREKPSDIAVFAPDQEVYAYVTFASVRAGDAWKAQLYRPNGTLVNNFGPGVFPEDRPQDGGWYRPGFTENIPGTWRVDFLYNDVKVGEELFEVATTPTAGRMRVFDDHAGVDTYIIDGRTTPIDFGNVAFGQPAPTKTFTVENHGYGSLTGLAVQLPAGFLLVEGLSTTIAAGASDSFTVQLDTTVVGARAGQIVVAGDGSANSIALAVEGLVDGNDSDFDGDGDTDGADFLAWQRHVGTPAGAAKVDGDANGDGAVNGADLQRWRDEFAQPPAAVAEFAAPPREAPTPETLPPNALPPLYGSPNGETPPRRWFDDGERPAATSDRSTPANGPSLPPPVRQDRSGETSDSRPRADASGEGAETLDEALDRGGFDGSWRRPRLRRPST